MRKTSTTLPVVLRPYPGELLYSWLARVAAIYNSSISELLTVSASPWDLCVMPSGELVVSLGEMTRLSSDVIRQLTISASGIRQAWWNIRQIAPDAFFPNVEYEYGPRLKFCRLCLWHDRVSHGNEFLRREWMLSVPTICPIHAVSMEDDCSFCHIWDFPTFVKTTRAFRLVCAGCERPLASRELPGKAALIPQVKTLQAFELVLSQALKNDKNDWRLYFPGAAAPQLFLQTVEDLLWLLLRTPRPEHDFQQLFLHRLNNTVIRVPRRLYRKPGAQPWLGDFPIGIRRGLVSHLAAVIGGTAIRQRLLVCPRSCFAFEKALEVLPPSDVKEFTRRLTSWPQMLKKLVFEPESIHH